MHFVSLLLLLFGKDHNRVMGLAGSCWDTLSNFCHEYVQNKNAFPPLTLNNNRYMCLKYLLKKEKEKKKLHASLEHIFSLQAYDCLQTQRVGVCVTQ